MTVTAHRAKVVHFSHIIYNVVMEHLDLSGFCDVDKNLPFLFNMLESCLKNRQLNEHGQKQGKFRDREMFCAELSTENVDSFSLAPMSLSLQAIRRIDDAREVIRA